MTGKAAKCGLPSSVGRVTTMLSNRAASADHEPLPGSRL